MCIDDCEVSSSAVVEVRFGGRSSDFYGMGIGIGRYRYRYRYR